MKITEKQKARELRQQGKSIGNIAKILKISKSSISIWVRDVQLTTEQKEKLKSNNPIFNKFIRFDNKTTFRNKRIEYQKLGMEQAKKTNPLHEAGCMLYWAEGAKQRTNLRFSNSDPNMLIFFLKFLYECYNVSKENIQIYINCYTTNGLTIEEIEKYWSDTLNIPIERFGKPTTDIMSKYSGRKTKNKLLYGTVSIQLGDVSVLQNIYGAIQYYAGFYNNYCLD
jgi:hypothetical protein